MAAECTSHPRHDAVGSRVQGQDNRVGRTVDGDDNARFNAAVMPHLNDAYRLARWLTGNRADAEDVVQDAFLRAFRAIGNFSGGNARAWVLTIVRHAAYQWLHKNRPAALVFVEDLESVTPAESGERDVETPEQALIAKTEATRLEVAIAALPVISRETLVLREVQGLAYREIAEVTGVPIGTVMSRLARARGQLIATISAETGPRVERIRGRGRQWGP
jgi:RNA polymerase sigma factor (sigma-70 family)